jgi:hypothetical protein
VSMKRKYSLIPALALGFALAHATQAQPTALSLADKGNDYVGIQSKDKIVEISSDKSVGDLKPNVWHVVYYDPNTPFKCQEVKFGSGQEMDVSHPVPRPFEPPRGEILDKSKLKVDSDQALNIATGQAMVKQLTLRAAKLTLTQGDVGPIWKVQLWAAKARNPDRETDIGTVTISASDGSMVKSDLRLNKAD